jgi:predicted enzyme related to lactoylglutathione lyase
MVHGLRTVIYKVGDLARARAFYSAAFETAPYFDEPYYVGFNIGGYELGLDPDTSESAPGPGGALAYWGVPDVAAAVDHFVRSGATLKSAPIEVGGGIKVASVLDPFGNPIGLIENPQFQVQNAS